MMLLEADFDLAHDSTSFGVFLGFDLHCSALSDWAKFVQSDHISRYDGAAVDPLESPD